MYWSRTAFIFPGQGSQLVGMGKDIAQSHTSARQVFEQANAALGFDFAALCFDGPEEQLNDTINTQPALFVTSIAILSTLQASLPTAVPAAVAGHSLGELTALTAAGSLTFEDGLALVRERGRLMKLAGEQNPGAMAALLGIDAAAAQGICARASQETGMTVVLANDNCPGQLVISGHEAALERAMQLAVEAGARKAVRLAVSIAAHSPLMSVAAVQFQYALAGIHFSDPQIPIYGNITAARLTGAEAIRQELNEQLTQPVRWTESIHAMIAAGIQRFVEIGSGNVLTGLLKRIDRNSEGVTINDAASLEQFIARFQS